MNTSNVSKIAEETGYPVSTFHLVTALSISFVAYACSSSRYDDSLAFFFVSVFNVWAFRLGEHHSGYFTHGFGHKAMSFVHEIQWLDDADSWIPHLDVATPIYEAVGKPEEDLQIVSLGVAVSLVGALVTLITARYSGAGCMLGYASTLTTLSHSGLLQPYKARMAAFIAIALVSTRSRHIRMLNLAVAAVLLERSVSSGCTIEEFTASRIVSAVWFSLLLCLVFDLVYVRTKLLDGLLSTLHLSTLAVAALMALELSRYSEATWWDTHTTWFALLQCASASQCCTGAAAREGPALVCALYSAVQLLRSARDLDQHAGSRWAWAAGGAITASVAFLFTDDSPTPAVYRDPYFAAVLLTGGMVVARALGRQSASDRRWASLEYWRVPAQPEPQEDALEAAGGEEPAPEGLDSGVDMSALERQALPSESEMNARWADVAAKLEGAETARRTYYACKDLVFKQEAVVRGTVPYNESTKQLHADAQRKADELGKKLREAAHLWKAKKDEAKRAEEEAKYWEAKRMGNDNYWDEEEK